MSLSSSEHTTEALTFISLLYVVINHMKSSGWASAASSCLEPNLQPFFHYKVFVVASDHRHDQWRIAWEKHDVAWHHVTGGKHCTTGRHVSCLIDSSRNARQISTHKLALHLAYDLRLQEVGRFAGELVSTETAPVRQAAQRQAAQIRIMINPCSCVPTT